MSENEKNLKKEKIQKLFNNIKSKLDKTDRKGLSPSTGSSPSTPSTPSTGSSPKRKSESLPTTVEQALADGWTMGRAVGMSNPPVFSFTKDGKTISIRGKMSEGLSEHMKKVKPIAKKTGGVIKRRGGGIAKRGFGISK